MPAPLLYRWWPLVYAAALAAIAFAVHGGDGLTLRARLDGAPLAVVATTGALLLTAGTTWQRHRMFLAGVAFGLFAFMLRAWDTALLTPVAWQQRTVAVAAWTCAAFGLAISTMLSERISPRVRRGSSTR